MALKGTIRVPSDKSISHRAVLFSALAQGTSKVADLLPSDDVLSSLAAVEALGARVDLAQGANGLSGTIDGFGGTVPGTAGTVDIDCGNSGTTTRLLLGMLSGLGVRARLHGDASLSTRPMARVLVPLESMGARFECEGGTLPVTVLPADALRGISYESPVSSAQVKSALLLAGLSAAGTTTVTEPAKSRDHTELMLPAYGVDVRVDGLRVSVEGPAVLSACDMRAPADPSSAAFVAVAAALVEGSDVLIEQVSLNPTRAGAFQVLERMGAGVSVHNQSTIGAEQVGDVRVQFAGPLRPCRVAADEIPTLVDEVPVLALLAASASGETVFESCGELRVKESDRFAAVCDGLAAFGVEAWAEGDDLHIAGTGLQAGAAPIELPVYHDHRLAMTWHIAQLVSGADVVVDDPACVSVSWPGFYSQLASLVA